MSSPPSGEPAWPLWVIPMPALDVTIEELDHWIERRFDRSGGPGGQHVNKVSTRVTLYFDFETSDRPSSAQKRLIRKRLGTRIAREGRLRVVSQRFRSQSGNRRAAEEKLIELLRAATHVARKRVPTRPSRASKERRLTEKRRRGDTKRLRCRTPSRDE